MVTLLAGAGTGAAVYLLVSLLFHLAAPKDGSTFFFMNFNPLLLAGVAAVIGGIKGIIVAALSFTRIPWLVRVAGVLLFNFNSVNIIRESIIGGDRYRLASIVWVIVVFVGSIVCCELVIRTRRPIPQR